MLFISGSSEYRQFPSSGNIYSYTCNEVLDHEVQESSPLFASAEDRGRDHYTDAVHRSGASHCLLGRVVQMGDGRVMAILSSVRLPNPVIIQRYTIHFP
jgi:hypothetical protein